MVTGIIFDIMKYSIHDGPGIRTTVFFKGCPLFCLWCHNPESQKMGQEIMFWEDRCTGCGACRRVCPQANAIPGGEKCILCGKCVEACFAQAREMVGKEVTTEEVMREIEKDLIFYDQSGGGVTFSGGEPLSQKNFLLSLLESCKKKEIHTAVDTSGYCKTEDLLGTAALTDLFLYDLKLMDEEKHRKYTGVSNALILNNLRQLSLVHGNINIRFPLIPGINDDEKNIRDTAEFITSLSRVKEVNILPYHHTGSDKYSRLKMNYCLPETKAPTQEKLEEAKEKLEAYGLSVKIGG